MTTEPGDNGQDQLESLYREAGDVEPDSGIDRSIRARARVASGKTSRPGLGPWVGGLATASIALTVITLAIRQPPPEPTAPVPQAQQQRAEAAAPDAAFSDAAGRSAAPEPAVAPQSDLAPPSPVAPAASADREQSADARERRQTRARRERPSRATAGESVRQAPTVVRETAAEPDLDPQASIERLRELVASGKLEQARALDARLKRAHPELKLPEPLRKALASGNSD